MPCCSARPADGAPGDDQVAGAAAGKVSDVGLLGSPEKPQWKQTAEGLIVKLPANAASEIAYALRIAWQDSK